MMTSAKLLVVGLFCVASTQAGAESQSSGQEAIGVGVGALVGGFAGGPVGAIVGAAFGAKLGDTLHARTERASDLEVTLAASRTEQRRLQRDLAHLEQDRDALGAELERLESLATPELAAMLQAGIRMDVLFRTGEHSLTETPSTRLQELAVVLAPLKNVRVRLDGFADERGPADYNLELSRKRAEFVRDALMAAGVPVQRIETVAHGEAGSVDESADSYALERRVSVTLQAADTAPLVANTE